MDQRDRLLESLQTVFPPYVPSAPAALHDCEECLGLRAALDGHTWQELPSSIATEDDGILPLLTPEAKHAFLPLWLRAGLLDPEGNAATLLLIHLQMSGPWGLVNKTQAVFILATARYIADNSDWLVDREGREAFESLCQAWSKAAA